MTNLASIDKIWLTIRDFEIATDTGNLKIKQRDRTISEPDGDSSGYLLRTAYGKDISGQRIYANTDRLNIDISRVSDGTLALKINSNPNKHHHEWQPSTDPDQYRAYRRQIEADLTELGISCSLTGATISRIDLAKQKQLRHPLMTYHPVFSHIQAKRQREAKHGDTYRVGNTQRQTAIYDKHIEAKLSDEYRNLIRLEHRFMTGRSVSKYTGLHSLADLDREIATTGFRGLTEIYGTYLTGEILTTYDRRQIDTTADFELMKAIARDHPARVFEIYTGNMGIHQAVQKFGSIENFAIMLTDTRQYQSEASRDRQIRRQINKIREQLRAMHRYRVATKPKTINPSDLYDEIAGFASAA